LLLTTPLQVVPSVASVGFLDIQAGAAQHYGVTTWLCRWIPGVPKLRCGCVEPLKKLRPIRSFTLLVFRPKRCPFPIWQHHKFSLPGIRGFAFSVPIPLLIHIFESKTELTVKVCLTAVATLFSPTE